MSRHRTWLLVVPVLLAGCGAPVAGQAAPGTRTAAPSLSRSPAPAAPTSAGPSAEPLRTCGPVPTPTGATAAVVAISATAPDAATSGSTLQVQLHLRSLDSKQHVLTTGQPSVLLTRDGEVVGAYEGGYGAVGVQIIAPPSGEATLTASGLVAGCPVQPVDYGAPDLTRKALPPGRYDAVVVLEDVTAKPWGNLVSAPVPVQVTADPQALPTCGDVPASTEPPQSRVAAVLTGPAVAKAGSTVQVQVMLRSNQGRPEQFETALPIEVLVVRGGSVVGRSDAAVAGVALTVPVPANGEVPMLEPTLDAIAHLRDVTLAGCPVADQGAASRQPLPKGTYELVGVLEDNVSGRPGVLVTQPLPVQVS